jgi:hypothetical protein
MIFFAIFSSSDNQEGQDEEDYHACRKENNRPIIHTSLSLM